MDEFQNEDEMMQYDEADAIYENVNLVLKSSDIQALFTKIQLSTEEVLYDLNSRDAFVQEEGSTDIDTAKQYIHYIVYMKLLENFRTQITAEQQNEIPEHEDEFAEKFADLDETLDSEGMLAATLQYGIFPYIAEDGILPVPITDKQKKYFEMYVKKINAVLDTALEKVQFIKKEEEKKWECRNCGHIYLGKIAPEVCPICAHSFSKEEDEISVEDLPGFDIDADISVNETLVENQSLQSEPVEENLSNNQDKIAVDIFNDSTVSAKLGALVMSEVENPEGIARVDSVLYDIITVRSKETKEINQEKSTEELIAEI